MKKQYVKPELYFENFELSMNIATGCDSSFIVNKTENSCTYDIGSHKVFAHTGCNSTPQESNVCYHVPENAMNLFSS